MTHALAPPLALGLATEEARAPSLAELYSLHARTVASVAFRLMGHDRDLDDIVQETFLDAASERLTRDRSVPVRTWLITLTVRRVRRLFARRRRFRLFGFRWLASAPTSTDPSKGEPARDLYAALEALPEDLRVPWTLHRVSQLTLLETAAACEVSLATVKRRIADAELRIARRLSQ